ncbi:MAG: hypothetical protein QM737_09400 [Ferruginibacter sp.]
MLQENLNEEINPRDIEDTGMSSDREKEINEDEEESYDILPSNSAGLEGNDGQQVIDAGDSDDDDDDDD